MLKATSSIGFPWEMGWIPSCSESSQRATTKLGKVSLRMHSLAPPRQIVRGKLRFPGVKNCSPACEIALVAILKQIYSLLRPGS